MKKDPKLHFSKRDPQQFKVYAAQKATSWYGTMGVFHFIQEAQWAVDAICADPVFFSRHHYRRLSGEVVPLQMTVTVEHEMPWSSASWDKMHIKLTPPHFKTSTLLHEVAHVITPQVHRPTGARLQAHGPEYCANLLWLFEHFRGPGFRADLEAEFVKQGVSWTSPVYEPAKRGSIFLRQRGYKAGMAWSKMMSALDVAAFSGDGFDLLAHEWEALDRIVDKAVRDQEALELICTLSNGLSGKSPGLEGELQGVPWVP